MTGFLTLTRSAAELLIAIGGSLTFGTFQENGATFITGTIKDHQGTSAHGTPQPTTDPPPPQLPYSRLDRFTSSRTWHALPHNSSLHLVARTQDVLMLLLASSRTSLPTCTFRLGACDP